jgi:hypothetical protein
MVMMVTATGPFSLGEGSLAWRQAKPLLIGQTDKPLSKLFHKKEDN